MYMYLRLNYRWSSTSWYHILCKTMAVRFVTMSIIWSSHDFCFWLWLKWFLAILWSVSQMHMYSTRHFLSLSWYLFGCTIFLQHFFSLVFIHWIRFNKMFITFISKGIVLKDFYLFVESSMSTFFECKHRVM